MLKKFYCCLFLFIYSNLFYSQTIKGSVKNELGEPVVANILIKNSENINLISEFFVTEDNGEFSFSLDKEYSKIFFEITSMGYEKKMDSILNLEKKKTYKFDLILKSKLTELEDVVIKREKVEIKGDTTSFNPSLFKDGTEKKVEDLLKKLPGVEVSDNGTIKYRGKSVKSLQIEGDDLFGFNYSIGTRNISVDMVQQVQAIDNYSENPLLRGIENSDDVSINLKLKKGKFDVSANGTLGSGFDSEIAAKNEISLNVLGISNKYKSFGSISYNNTGVNNSSEDYFSMSSNLEDILNQEVLAKKVIPENIFSSSFDEQRANINNQFALSYSLIYRFSKKFSMKTNIYFLKDRITLFEENNVLFSTDNINYNDQSEIIKNPQNKRIEFKLTYNINKLSLLEIDNTLQEENIETTSNIVQNLAQVFDTSLSSNDILWRPRLKYTLKLSNNKAIQFISNNSFNKIPQKLNTYQSVFAFNGDEQNSMFKKTYFSNRAVLLGNTEKIKYVIQIGHLLDKSLFDSDLKFNQGIVNGFQNNFDYQERILFTEIGLNYNEEKWKFQPTLRLSSIEQNHIDELSQITNNNHSLVILPTLNIAYMFSSKASIKLSGNFEQKTPAEENLFINSLALSNRYLRKNDFSLELQKNQNYSLSYRVNNPLTSFSTNFTLTYDTKKNSYISMVDIQNNYSTFNYFQSPTNIENYSINLGVEKYLSFLKTTIKHNSNYSINNYKNIINQSELRNNQSLVYSAYFYINTSFRLPINVQNKFNYSKMVNKLENSLESNSNVSFNNLTKILIKPNKYLLFSINYDYYLPNTRNKDKFTFLDFEARYKPKNANRINFTLTGKNLLNNKFYSQFDNTDFQTTFYKSSLMHRYYLLTLDFKL